MVTPGAAAQLENLTCTPDGQGEQEMFGNIEQQNHYQATTPYNFHQQHNKSDSEKVLAKKLVVVTFKNDDLDILYKARGKEIDILEKELADKK